MVSRWRVCRRTATGAKRYTVCDAMNASMGCLFLTNEFASLIAKVARVQARLGLDKSKSANVQMGIIAGR